MRWQDDKFGVVVEDKQVRMYNLDAEGLLDTVEDPHTWQITPIVPHTMGFSITQFEVRVEKERRSREYCPSKGETGVIPLDD